MLRDSVKQSKNPSLQGLTGIIIQETEGTWSIAQPNDTVKGKIRPFFLELFKSANDSEQCCLSLEAYSPFHCR